MISAGTATSNRFLPCRLANLQLWLHCFRSIITKDGDDLISQWNDISGNTRHATQSADANKMTFGTNQINSIDVVQCGNTSFMNVDLTFLAGNTSYSLYGITQHGACTGGQLYYWLSSDYNPNQPGRCLHIGYFNPVTAQFGQFGTDLAITIPNPTGTETQLWDEVFIAGSGHRALYNSANTDYTNTNATTTGMTSADTGKIGSGFDSTNYWRGDIAETFLFDTDNSAAEEGWIQIYLKTTWGITL